MSRRNPTTITYGINTNRLSWEERWKIVKESTKKGVNRAAKKYRINNPSIVLEWKKILKEVGGPKGLTNFNGAVHPNIIKEENSFMLMNPIFSREDEKAILNNVRRKVTRIYWDDIEISLNTFDYEKYKIDKFNSRKDKDYPQTLLLTDSEEENINLKDQNEHSENQKIGQREKKMKPIERLRFTQTAYMREKTMNLSQFSALYNIEEKILRLWLEHYKAFGTEGKMFQEDKYHNTYENDLNNSQEENAEKNIISPDKEVATQAEIQVISYSKDEKELKPLIRESIPENQINNTVEAPCLGIKIKSNFKRKQSEISPSFRLFAARQATKVGVERTASTLQISACDLRKWVEAYRVVGADAYIFNNWLNKKFNNQLDKKKVALETLKESSLLVRHKYGVELSTLKRWREMYVDGGESNIKSGVANESEMGKN